MTPQPTPEELERLKAGQVSRFAPPPLPITQVPEDAQLPTPQLPAAPAPKPAIAAPAAPAANSALDSAKSEYSRLTSGPQSKAGVDQIKNPFLRHLGQAGNIALSVLAPGISTFVPGTSMHHELVVHDAARNLNQQDEMANSEEKRHQQHASALEQESLPEYHQTQAELAQSKLDAANQQNDAKNQLGQSEHERKVQADQFKADATGAARRSSLAQHGFKEDETGKIVPLEYAEMSEQQQAVHDLTGSRAELADAQKAFKDAQTKQLPAQMELAKRRIDNANHTASIAEQRLGLSKDIYDARYHGTQNGEALPGAMVADSGQTVGAAFSGNVKPTGTQRVHGDLATSATEQIADMKAIISRHPEVFGPFGGRKTDLETWIGSQDPDASRFRTARTLAADHAAGAFGGRSSEALKELNDALGRFKDNPEAAMAGLEGFGKANKTFMKAGKVNTVGAAPQGQSGFVKPGGALDNLLKGGK